MLLFTFLTVMGLSFGILAAFSRVSPEEEAVAKRFSEIHSLRSQVPASGAQDAALRFKEEGTTTHALLRRLAESRAAAALSRLQVQAHSAQSPGALLARCAGCGAVAGFAAGLLMHSVAVAVLAVALAGSGPVALLVLRRRRRLAAFDKALPDALDMMSRSLRAGHSMTAALGMLAEHAAEPVAAEFAEVFRKQNFGVPVRDALLALLERVPSHDLRVAVTAILVQKESGGNLAEVLSRSVLLVRERQRLQGEVRTHTAQGRVTGWILCALPPVMLLVINVLNPGYSRVLFTRTPGPHAVVYRRRPACTGCVLHSADRPGDRAMSVQTAFVFSRSVTVFLLACVCLVPFVLRPSRGARRMLELVKSSRADRRRISRAETMRQVVMTTLRTLGARLGLTESAELNRSMEEAGLRGPQARETFLTARLVLPLCGLAAGAFVPGYRVFGALCGCGVLYLSPGLWLKFRARKRRHAIRRSIPDALDLLGICVEAGLGIDQALLRVGAELSVSHTEINDEFTQVNLERRAGKPRLDAWASLAERTQLDEFKSFVSMLAQTDRFGTPIVKALNGFSEEIRMKRTTACRAGRGENEDQDHLSACPFHLPVRLHRAAGAGTDGYLRRSARPEPLGACACVSFLSTT